MMSEHKERRCPFPQGGRGEDAAVGEGIKGEEVVGMSAHLDDGEGVGTQEGGGQVRHWRGRLRGAGGPAYRAGTCLLKCSANKCVLYIFDHTWHV